MRIITSKVAKTLIIGAVTVALISALALASRRNHPTTPRGRNGSNATPRRKGEAETVGRELAGGNCDGTGVPYKLSVSPMRPQDFSVILPYGIVTGGHVTPIDHQYFEPADPQSAWDSYDVRAMADARLTSIEPRVTPRGTEYRMVFSVSCTFFYYYDLVTSLAPDITSAFSRASGNGPKITDIRVRAGEVVGRIGGQTLDFAVWDTTKPLHGFVVPEHYAAEVWKIYTADPLEYSTANLKALLVSRYVRTAKPISGKIDDDIDGRLVGTWFRKGTNGYEGLRATDPEHYSKTHLAFIPDPVDPSFFVVSMGDFGGDAAQFGVRGNAPQPRTISMSSGLVKLDLVRYGFVRADGTRWDNRSLAEHVKAQAFDGLPSEGCALVQMVAVREIRFEAFKGRPCRAVAGFDSAAKLYTR